MKFMMDIKCITRINKRGQVTIEAAIAFSCVLILVCNMFTIMSVYRTHNIMQQAVDQCVEDLQLVPPAQVIASDLISTISNALPDNQITNVVASGVGIIGGVASRFGALTGISIQDLIVNGTLAGRIRNDILYNYSQMADSYGYFAPQSVRVYLNYNEMNSYIELELTYCINTIVGEIDKTIYSVIPVYGTFHLTLIGDNEENEQDEEAEFSSDTIWSAGNFERGEYFRESYGGNLPGTFPVIAGFDDGVATSITSIDMTSPRYSDSDNVNERISEELSDLSLFDGADVNINGQHYQINGSDITSRQLIIVIPENTNDMNRQLLNDVIENNRQNGIDIHIVEDGNSYRYNE